MRKFKLLKDTPSTKKGAVFIFNEIESLYIFQIENNCQDYYFPCFVENNPEWFEEVMEGVKSAEEYLEQEMQSTLYKSVTDRAKSAINTAMIDSWNAAIDETIENRRKQYLEITPEYLKKPKDFKF